MAASIKSVIVLGCCDEPLRIGRRTDAIGDGDDPDSNVKLDDASRNNLSEIMSQTFAAALDISPDPSKTTPIFSAQALAARLANVELVNGFSWLQTKHKRAVHVNKTGGDN
jgi:hypothetical protein